MKNFYILIFTYLFTSIPLIYMVNPKRKKKIKIQFIYHYSTRQIILKTINENRNKESICITFHLDLQQYHFDNSD